MPKKETTAEKQKQIHVEVVKQMLTLATSGFGLVAALAWNNVIRELVDNYIAKYMPEGSGLISLFLYAIVVTVLAVIVTYQLTKILDRLESK